MASHWGERVSAIFASVGVSIRSRAEASNATEATLSRARRGAAKARHTIAHAHARACAREKGEGAPVR
jgi:hypothetical protein